MYEHHESTTEAGRTAVKALLERDPHLTAILCLSDQLALGVLEALKSAGLSVPEDVSVAGFDDVPEASRSTPPLTTVHQPHVEKGLLPEGCSWPGSGVRSRTVRSRCQPIS